MGCSKKDSGLMTNAIRILVPTELCFVQKLLAKVILKLARETESSITTTITNTINDKNSTITNNTTSATNTTITTTTFIPGNTTNNKTQCRHYHH
ncbi:hypothetical protein DPMN_151058 [Dreissena polymorpha]|uniref:Uncharacterized protein n=1 Tax=Dreissena polymorpha TaxID=45954 RepID=A0A9D4FKG1_DREPO|nr:hypothetical protein DPMN_151058 [Dreissena polymorpha]